MDEFARRRLDKIQCQLNLIELMQFDLLLERLDARDPGRWKFGYLCKQLIPSCRCIRGSQCVEQCKDPFWYYSTKPRTNPVALGIGGAAGVRFDHACLGKARGESPYELQGRTIFHIKEFQNHGSTGCQGCEASQCFRN